MFKKSIKTNLPNTWHDKDTLLLHACFSLLVDFVENECSHMAVYCGMTKKYSWRLKYLPKWIRRKFFKIHNAELGLMYLKDGLEEKKMHYNKTDLKSKHSQALRKKLKMTQKEFEKYWYLNHFYAQEIIDLYNWWTKERPTRMKLDDSINIDQLSDQDIINIVVLEDAYYREDTEKLIKLMQIREYLWT